MRSSFSGDCCVAHASLVGPCTDSIYFLEPPTRWYDVGFNRRDRLPTGIFRMRPIWVIVIGIVLTNTARLRSREFSLPNALQAHKSAREGITSFRGSVTFESKPIRPTDNVKTEFCSGDFWITPEAARCHVNEFGSVWDRLLSRTVRTTIIKRADGTVGATRMLIQDRHYHRCDPFVAGLLALNLPGTVRYMFLEQLIEEAKSKPTVQKDMLGGAPMVRLDLEFDFRAQKRGIWRAGVWLDPSHNHLVHKVTYDGDVGAGGTILREQVVSEFAELAPGLFFPASVRGRDSLNGEWKHESTATISRARINEPISGAMFVQSFPHGVILVDSTRNTSYPVDRNGQRIGVEVPLVNVPPPASAQSHDGRASTSEDERSWSRLALYLGLALVLLGSVLIAARRWRSA